MPLPADEVLRQLVAAADEARVVIRDLHQARAAALDVVKANRRAITAAIEEAVTAAVGELSAEARARMRDAADEIILTIERDWRAALHLDAR